MTRQADSNPCPHWRRWLLVLVLFAGAIRLYGVNWDQTHHFHPDERAIAEAITRIRLNWNDWQLNPKFFAYGSLPFYLTRVVTDGLMVFNPRIGNYDNILIVGRSVSGVIGAVTVALLVLLGARLFNPRVGLLAGFLLAAAPLHIQTSHFMATDVALTLMVLIALWAIIGLAQRGRTRDYCYAGGAVGLAVATKFSAMPLLAPLGVAILIRLGRDRRFVAVTAQGALALLSGLVAFAVGEPYAFSTFDPAQIAGMAREAFAALPHAGLREAVGLFLRKVTFDAYASSIIEQSGMVQNAGRLPYTNQYVGTPKYLYELTQIVLWGMAPPLGLAAIWATVRQAGRTVRERSVEHLVLLAYVVPFFLITGWFEVKFPRYLLPIYPIVILWAAAWLHEAAERGWIGRVAQWSVVGGTFLAAMAFLSIYQRPHTVVTASEWVHKSKRIPVGSTLLTQHWDEGFPFSLPDYPVNRLKIIELPYYEPDTPAKIRGLSEQLAKGDFLAFQTKRLFGAITQAAGQSLPRNHPAFNKFPYTNNYFYQLFAGDLGYTLIYDHASRPRIFGIEFPDELADESLTVYDHPKVLIFENTGRLSADEIYRKIMNEAPSKALTRRDLLLARSGEAATPIETDDAARHAGGPTRSSWAALFRFVLAVELMGLCAYAILHRWLPVSGSYALAKVLGVLGFAYAPWLLTALGLTSFTRGTLCGTLLAMSVWALVARRRWESGPERAEWKPTEALFWGVFLFLLLNRSLNPEAFWGEKPMDFSFLNALTRSTNIPPPEPWFAGSTLHYSYFGHYVVAALGKLCHIHPGITFNLGIAVVGALTAVAVFAAGCAISDRWRVGILAAVFATLFGNLSGPREAIGRHWRLNFDYFWATSRVIKDSINEYPLWSFLFADLHAHVLVMPFSLTFVTLALWWVRRREPTVSVRSGPLLLLLGVTLGAIMITNTWSTFTYVPFFPFLLFCADLGRRRPGRGRSALLCGLLLALLVAFVPDALQQLANQGRLPHALAPVQPTVRALLGTPALTTAKLALAGATALTLCPAPTLTAATVVGLGFVLYGPYWLDLRGNQPHLNWGIEGDAFAHAYDFVTIFGLFLVIGIPFLFALWRRQLLTPDRATLAGPRALLMTAVGTAILVCLLLTIPYGKLTVAENLTEFLHIGAIPGQGPLGLHRFAVLKSVRTALLILAALALHVTLHRSLSPLRRRIAILLSFAFFVTAGVDLVHIWDRMNTVFKFYLEAWFVFSIAAAAAVYELWWGLIESPTLRRVWRSAVVLLAAVAAFTAVTATYGAFTTRRVATPRPTLDGTAYLPQHDRFEAAAFEFLNENVPGIPVIAEAFGPSYQEFTRVSMNTGLPTVLGWEYHLTQRGQTQADINRRKSDLLRLYTTEDEKDAAAVLRKYKVAMVYVGAMERRAYGGANLERFKQWTDLLTPIYQNGGVTIFGVSGQFAATMPVSTIEEVPHESGDVVPPPDAPGRLTQPRGLARDRQGNLYVADFGNHRIQKFSPSLEFVKTWGENGSQPGAFNQPCAVAVDAQDTVYVADTWNQRIQVFGPDGAYRTEWGGPFFGPRGIAIDAGGTIYLADTGNHRIRRFAPDHSELPSWGSAGKLPGQFKEPIGIAVDAEGRLYVCDNGNSRLQILNPDGSAAESFTVAGWESTTFSEPFVTVTPGGVIWVSVPLAGAVRAYDRTGKLLHEIKGDGSPEFEKPMGVVYDPQTKTLIIADLANRLVRLPVPPALQR